MSNKVKDQIKTEIHAFGKQLNAGWNTCGKIAHKVISHHLQHSQDLSLPGKLANVLTENDYAQMLRAFKKASHECAGIRFKENEKTPGTWIAHLDKNKVRALSKDETGIKALTQLSEQGLRSFIDNGSKPKKKSGSNVKSMQEVMANGIQLGITALSEVENLAPLAKDFQGRLTALHSEIKQALIQYGLGNSAKKMIQGELSTVSIEKKEEEVKPEESDDTETNDIQLGDSIEGEKEVA